MIFQIFSLLTVCSLHLQIILGQDLQCGDTIQAEQGYLVSPNYPNDYYPNTTCEYRIACRPKQRIHIECAEFHLEDSPNCRNDVLQVFDSVTNLHLQSYCGFKFDLEFVSYSNDVTLRLITDEAEERKGFKCHWMATVLDDMKCDKNVEEDTGVFTSIGYPYVYPNNVDCVMGIIVSESPIDLRFEVFKLEETPSCLADYMEIYDDINNGPLHKFCIRPGNNITVQTRHVYVRFKTDGVNSDLGFNISWQGGKKIPTVPSSPDGMNPVVIVAIVFGVIASIAFIGLMTLGIYKQWFSCCSQNGRIVEGFVVQPPQPSFSGDVPMSDKVGLGDSKSGVY